MFDTLYKKIGLAIGLFLIVYIVIDYAGKVLSLLLPLLFALIISYKIHPLIQYLDKHLPLPRSIISLLSVILIIGIVSLGIYAIVHLFIFGVKQLANVLPQATDEFNKYYQSATDAYHTYFRLIPEDWQGIATNSLNSLLNQASGILTTFLSNLINTVTFLPNILIFIVFTLLTSYFVSRDFETVNKFTNDIQFFLHSKPLYHEVKANVFLVLIGYLKAQLILMTLTFIISCIGLFMLDVPYAPLIALCIALIDALPMFGPAVVYVPWIISRLLLGHISGAIALGILYLVATLTRQTLEPKIVSSQIGVHPIITLSAMYAGLKLFGFLGIILGPLSAVTIIKSYRILTCSRKHEH